MNPRNGGPCQGIRNAVPELKKLDVENEVVCFDDKEDIYGVKDEFVIFKLGKPTKLWSYNSKLVKWLYHNLCNYDVVIIHGLWLYHSYATIKSILKYKKEHKSYPKVYVMPHGMLDPYFQIAQGRKLKAIRNNFYWKFIENNVVNSADGVLFTCEEELILARKAFPNYLPKKEINVGYGIEKPKQYSKELKEALTQKAEAWNGKPFLLFLSRIHQKKGLLFLINAYLRLEKEINSIPQLIIAGPGIDSNYGQDMLRLAKTSDNIIFTGMLKGDAKWGAFYEAEAFVLPSHQENFGIAVVEALACKTPVLISNKVNIWREIKKGNGGIVKNDNEEGTYDLLKEWLTLPSVDKESITNSAKEVYQNFFTIEKAAKQFVNGIN
jgi:glycosyltransferase involved in cell wall biosynthesis